MRYDEKHVSLIEILCIKYNGLISLKVTTFGKN